MSIDKNNVKRLVDELPEGASVDDLYYRLYVQDKLKRALKEADDGETIALDEALRIIAAK